MQVTCPKCQSAHTVASVPEGGLSYVCPSCAHCFHIEPAPRGPSHPRGLGGARVLDATHPAPDANLDYFVKRSNNRVIGPFKARMVEQMIRSGQVDTTTEVSTDKVQWRMLNASPEFAPIFKEDHRPGVAARTNAPPPPSSSAPTKPPPPKPPAIKPPTPALQLQPSSLADIGKGGRAPKLHDVSIGEFPIAGTQRAEEPWELDFEEFEAAPEPDDLPKPRGLDPIDDLPKPRTKGSPPSALPSLKPIAAAPAVAANSFPTPRFIDPQDLPDLPSRANRPAAPAGAPASASLDLNLDLPAPQRGGPAQSLGLDLDLPAPQRGGPAPSSGLGLDLDLDLDLPSPQGSLPSPRGNLPSPQGNLPSPQGNLPSPQGNLPSLQGNLPSLQGSLPAARGTARALDDDFGLLGASAPLLSPGPTEFDPLPLLSPAQPMGSFSEPRMSTALGRPPLPDVAEPLPLLANAPAPATARLDDHLDLGGGQDSLFSPSLGQTQAGLPHRDLSQGFSPLGFDDDPLGLKGGGGAAPQSAGAGLELQLDVGPAPAPAPATGLDYGMLDLDIPAPTSAPAPTAPRPQAAPSAPSATPLPPAAPLTTAQPEATPLSAEARHDRALAQKASKSPQKGTSGGASGAKRSKALVGVVALVLLAAAAVGALYALKVGPFAAPASTERPSAQGRKPASGGGGSGGGVVVPDDASQLTLEPLKLDTFGAYHQFIAATEALYDRDPTPRLQAVLVLANALLFSRYPEAKTAEAVANIKPLQDVSVLAPESPWHALITASSSIIDGKINIAPAQQLITKTDMPFFGHLILGISHLSLAQAAPPAERDALLTKAQESFERALKEDPKAPVALSLLGQTLERADKKSSATESYTQALATLPTHTPSLLALTHLYLHNSQLDRARDLLNRLFQDDPAQADALSTGERAQAQYLSGLYALTTNDLPSAISSFQASFKLAPPSDDLIRDTAIAYERSQQPGDGAAFLTEAFGESPKDLEPLLALARLRTAEGRAARNPAFPLQQAQAAIDAALAAFPDHPRALLALAHLQQAQGKPTEAEATFQRVLSSDPQNIDARIELTGLLLSSPDPTQADALIKDLRAVSMSKPQRARFGTLLLSHPDRARDGVTLLEELCAASPNDALPREALATYYIQNKDFSKALEHLEAIRRALALRPATRYQLALALHATNSDRARLDRASELLADTLKDDPDHTDASLLLGQILFQQEKLSQARATFEQVLTKRPRDAQALFFLGRCELASQNPAAALPHLRAAYEVDKNQGEYALYLAMALDANGDTADALRLYTDVIRTPFAEKDHRPHLLRARLLRPQGSSKRKSAILDLQKALSISPSAPDIHEELARALFEDRKFEQALDALLVIEQEYKQTLSPEGYVVRGLAHASLIKGGPTEAQHRAAAIAALEAARDGGYPDLKRPTPLVGMNEPPMLYRYLGYLYRDAGQKSQSIEAFERYLDLARTIDTGERRSITGEILRLKG